MKPGYLPPPEGPPNLYVPGIYFEGWLALMTCGVVLVTIGFALNLIEGASVPQACT
jgi:hypothetical protein